MVSGSALKPIMAGLLIALLGFTLAAMIRGSSKRKLPYLPMILQAKKLNLSFDQVAAEPDKYLEKHVIWCVQNRAKDQTSYQGDPNRRLFVFNYQQMPVFTGSKHSACTAMLLQIKGVKKSESAPGTVGVMFIKEIN